MTTHARLWVALLAVLLPAAAAAEATGRRHPVCVAIFPSNDCPTASPSSARRSGSWPGASVARDAPVRTAVWESRRATASATRFWAIGGLAL